MKVELPEGTVMKYELKAGTPTLSLIADLTTQAQVTQLIGQLEKLAAVLPTAEKRARRSKNSSRPTTRAARQPKRGAGNNAGTAPTEAEG